MTHATETAELQRQRDEWVARAAHAIAEVASWCESEGWTVEQATRNVRDRHLGDYQLPALRARLPEGDLLVEPVGWNISGGAGRIDIEGIPTLSRVKLIGGVGGWSVLTDSNVPLRQPWNRQTFVQLAHDLLT